MTLREYINFWQETYDKSQSRPTTYAAHNYVFKNHIIPGLGDIPLSELTSEMVEDFLEERRRFGNHRPGSSGLGEETMRHIHRLLQQCLDQAMRDGLIGDNPARAFHYSKPKKVNADVLTPLEMEDYLDAAERLGHLPMFMLALTTGLGVTEELLLNDLSENDEKNLRNFTGAVLYNRKIGFPNMEQDQFYGAFKIANLVIWIWAKRQLDGMYSIDSFFKLHQIALFTDDDVDLKKPIQASQFVLFDKKGLVHISNMDYEMVYSDISQTPPSPEYCTKVNFLVLDMIGAYDEQTRHDEKLLNLAEKICDWLKSIESMIDPEVLLLNKLQITKRRRTLSMSEIIELAKLTENSYPPATRCGSYLLMDADEEAQKCFDELPLIAQEEFLKYPICHFGKPTMKEDKTNG